MKEHPIHAAAEIFPAMRPEEFAALRADIRENGQRDPVTLYRGMLLDGRNRARACRELDIPCKTEEWGGEGGDPVAFVVSRNLHRRHLDESGRAMVAARIANLPNHRPTSDTGTASIDAVPVSQPDAASLLNVSRASTQRAAKVIREGVPALAKAVDSGKVKVAAAAEVAALSKLEQEKVVAQGPKAVAKKAAELRHAGKNGRAKKGKRRKAPQPAPWLSEGEVNDGLAAVETLLKKWRDVGTLRNLVRDWEDNKLWSLCDRMDDLGRTLRRHATELREWTRRRRPRT